MSTETTFVDNTEAHQFELWEGNDKVGHIDYSINGPVITMPHTVVDPAHGGKGYGGVLAKGALDSARAAGLSVVPECPFIKGWIAKHPDYADLVHEMPETDDSEDA
jgi:predicted GNAT family acetyltransferase